MGAWRNNILDRTDSKKVAILLASYNGEKYISQQLDSLLEQTHKNIRIYIRDDNSTDNTRSIIKSYRDDRIVFIPSDENIGCIDSFFFLMNQVQDEAYAAFCDQDDVWEPFKIEQALSKFEDMDECKPIMVFSAYNICDENLAFRKHSLKIKTPVPFRKSLFQSVAPGFSIVLNKMAIMTVRQNKAQRTQTKDPWIGMICTGLGEAIHSPVYAAKYRRHGKSVSDTDKRFLKVQVSRLRTLFSGGGFPRAHNEQMEFYELFKDKLPACEREELEFFLDRSSNPVNILRKVFYPHRLRYTAFDEIMLRFMFFLRKV